MNIKGALDDNDDELSVESSYIAYGYNEPKIITKLKHLSTN